MMALGRPLGGALNQGGIMESAGRRFLLLPLAALCVSVLTGCAGRHLEPAPTALRVPGSKNEAVAETAGVRVTVDGKAWKGEPSNLQDVMIPIRVRLENNSGRPIRIRYSEFALQSGGNLRVSAIPPNQIRGTVPGPAQPVTPAFGYGWYGPYWGGWPGYYHRWGYWAYDPWFYDTVWVSYPISLPTEDMLEKALPEGVLQPGGHAIGFIYFPSIGEKVKGEKAKAVDFEQMLVDANTGRTFGTVEIPLIQKG